MMIRDPRGASALLQSETKPRQIKLSSSIRKSLGTTQKIVAWIQQECMSCQERIEELDLSDCCLQDDVTLAILQLLINNDAVAENISELNLSGNGFGGVQVGASLGELLVVRPFLQCVRLDRNQVDATFLAAMMRHAPSASTVSITNDRRLDLYLYGNNLGDQGIRVLAKSPWRRHFRVLHLGSNGLTRQSLPWLGHLLAVENNLLQELDLFANLELLQGDNSPRHGINLFAQSLHQSSLQKLRLCMCPFPNNNNDTAVALFSHLPASLKCLHARHCQLTTTAYRRLALQLQNLPRLFHLTMDGWNNNINQAKVVPEVWRTALDRHTTLCEIQVSRINTHPRWNTHYLLGICQRNQLLVRVQEAIPSDSSLALACPIIARLGRTKQGFPALYSFLRERQGLIPRIR